MAARTLQLEMCVLVAEQEGILVRFMCEHFFPFPPLFPCLMCAISRDIAGQLWRHLLKNMQICKESRPFSPISVKFAHLSLFCLLVKPLSCPFFPVACFLYFLSSLRFGSSEFSILFLYCQENSIRKKNGGNSQVKKKEENAESEIGN